MRKYGYRSSRLGAILPALAVYAWLTVLSPLSVTDVYYSVYLLCGSLGLVCLWDNRRSGCLPGREAWIGGLLFSLAVAAANYPLYTPLKVLQNLLNLALLLLGGFAVGVNVLAWMADHLPLDAAPGLRRRPGRVFWGSFAAVAAIDLCYLFFARYPGIMTTDSFATMGQIQGTMAYNNIMPFWHTMLVEAFVEPGKALFGDLNAAVALYHGAQALLMAACIGYVMVTLYQMGAHCLWMALVFTLYAAVPWNIAYSVTLWKDVPFAACAVVMVTALYRILKGIGRAPWLNSLAFALGAFGFCLLRTNGWYAFAVTMVVMAALLYREHRGLLLGMAAITVVTWLLIGPVLKIWGVEETNFVEAFGVPMQQIARVVANERPIGPEDTRLLGEIFWLDQVGVMYDPHNVDPVKYYTFRGENLEYLLENKGQYLLLYLRLGLQNPGDYFQAWVEQTKGYWNGGYLYYTYTQVLGENTLGLYQTPGQGFLARCYAALFRYMEKPAVFQCLSSIGLHTWALAACAMTTAAKKREEFALTVPILVLIAGLCLGTPVYAEFRYAYPMILAMPMILSATIYGQKERTQFR